MSVKQDRVAARTATDIERKYNFGKKFSEILGLIDDSRDKVDSVESTLRGEITKTATSLSRDTESIVAKATAEVKSELNESITDVNGNVTELESRVTEVSKQVELKMDADSVNVAIDNKATEITNQQKIITDSLGESISDLNGDVVELNKSVSEVNKQLDLKMSADEVNLAISKKATEITTQQKVVTDSLGESISGLDGEVTELNKNVTEVSNQLNLKMDAESVDIAIDKKLSNGVDRVETSTGYRFDSEGLSIRKSGEEMSNLLDNTGMRVTRSGENILVANNKGVEALNLHAKTYLIIGSGDGRSRLEDYGTNRTGIFWVG